MDGRGYVAPILMTLTLAGLLLANMPLAYFSLALLAVVWLFERFEDNKLAVKKVRFNKDRNEFEVLLENTSPHHLWVKYAIRSIQPATAPAEAVKEGGMTFLKGSSSEPANNYLLLTENRRENFLEPGKTAAISSENMALEDTWNPGLHGTVTLTASYRGGKVKKPRKIKLKAPLEISRTHPYLRDVGHSRAFVFTKDGRVVGKARSLEQLTDHLTENPESFLMHWSRGDIQRWVKHVIGDETLHLDMTVLSDTSEQAPNILAELINRRLDELNQSRFSGTHPMLEDVEPWHAFHFKAGETKVIGVCTSMHSLLDILHPSPLEAVKFHLSRGNDFADWIENVIGDDNLSRRIREIDPSNPHYAKIRISRLISERIGELSQ